MNIVRDFVWCPWSAMWIRTNDKNSISFTKNVTLRYQSLSDFLLRFTSRGKEIFWLDFTGFQSSLNDIQALIDCVEPGAVVRITVRTHLNGNPVRYFHATQAELDERIIRYIEACGREFGDYWPANVTREDLRAAGLPFLIQRILRLVVEKSHPLSSGSAFRCLQSSYYSDGTQRIVLLA